MGVLLDIGGGCNHNNQETHYLKMIEQLTKELENPLCKDIEFTKERLEAFKMLIKN